MRFLLYFRFPLSLRLIEEMLFERGILVSYETVRRWGLKFGQDFVRRLKRKRPSRSDIWHLDEVVVSIAGKKHWLWRAVDQEGHILDEILQTRCDPKAAGAGLGDRPDRRRDRDGVLLCLLEAVS